MICRTTTLIPRRTRIVCTTPPSKQLIAEEHPIPISCVVDIIELKIQLVKVCRIDSERPKLYTKLNGDIDSFQTSANTSLSPFQDDKNGAC